MPGLVPEPNWPALPYCPRGAGLVTIALVNNMPDAALKSTERQFGELLAQASGNRPVRVRIYSFSGIARSEDASRYVRDNHEPIEALWKSAPDGLIVTGTEPCAADLADEPYWPALTRLIDWAAEHTVSTVWSCLAAHAAVRHLDGIGRRRYETKLSGVFECATVADHPLTGLSPAGWCTPHSRWNGLDEAALTEAGYQILGRSPDAGIDIFARRDRSLFLCLQGHPEYDAGALWREYRRDVGRFLAGERDAYPDLPHAYFDADAQGAMLGFRDRALRARNAAMRAEFPTPPHRLRAPWRDSAIRLFANWLGYLAEAKSRRAGWEQLRPSALAVTKGRPVHG